MKKQTRVLKLSRETLRTLNEPDLGAAHGGIVTAVCTIKCASGTICSCGETMFCGTDYC
jgi:hypothetical protein